MIVSALYQYAPTGAIDVAGTRSAPPPARADGGAGVHEAREASTNDREPPLCVAEVVRFLSAARRLTGQQQRQPDTAAIAAALGGVAELAPAAVPAPVTTARVDGARSRRLREVSPPGVW